MPSVSFTPAQAADALTRFEASWAAVSGMTDPVTYAYRATTPAYSVEDADVVGTFRPLTDAQKQAVETSMAAWANVSNLKFTAVDPASYSDTATILFANFTDFSKTSAGFAFYPLLKEREPSSREGDVFLEAKAGPIADPGFGTYDYSTIIHEIGHAIGLAHPGSYNATAGVTLTYAKDAEFIEDSLQYTIMSYFEASETGAQHTYNGTKLYGTTPLLFDILAMQKLYGANLDFATGDNVYGFNANCDPAFVIKDAQQQVIYSIWDAGGRDVLDFSGYADNQRIDLRQGAFSDVGALTKNVSIAYGAVIEDAVGGAGNDSFTGNDVDNRFFGGAGSDRFFGGKGNDSIDGGTSAPGVVDIDISSYTGLARQYEVVVRAKDLVVSDRVAGRDGTDTLVNIQGLEFSDSPLDVSFFQKTASLAKAQIDSLVDIYIASFNRAPDALGLNYWGSRLKDGMGVEAIAKSFFVQPETLAKYPTSTTDKSFVNTVYGNVLGRSSDPAGLTYWVGELGNGHVTRDKFLLAILNGARANAGATLDIANIDNKVSVGEYFALAQGLNNGAWSQTVMAGVTSSVDSVTAANALTDGFATIAAAADTSELVVKVLGIVS